MELVPAASAVLEGLAAFIAWAGLEMGLWSCV